MPAVIYRKMTAGLSWMSAVISWKMTAGFADNAYGHLLYPTHDTAGHDTLYPTIQPDTIRYILHVIQLATILLFYT